MNLEIKPVILPLVLHNNAKWIVGGLNQILYLSFVIGTVFAQYQNIAVVENDAMEQTLPDFLRNPFYRTPRIREALAYSSWLGPGERLVFDRHSEKIPRWEIYSVLTHAGLVERRRNFP